MNNFNIRKCNLKHIDTIRDACEDGLMTIQWTIATSRGVITLQDVCRHLHAHIMEVVG